MINIFTIVIFLFRNMFFVQMCLLFYVYISYVNKDL